MRKPSIYQVIATYGLLLIFALPLGMQGLHSWLDQHEEQAHCNSDSGQIHIHDQSYAFDHCFLCAFHFSQYTENFSPSFNDLSDLMHQTASFEDPDFFLKRRHSSKSPRAPPTAA